MTLPHAPLHTLVLGLLLASTALAGPSVSFVDGRRLDGRLVAIENKDGMLYAVVAKDDGIESVPARMLIGAEFSIKAERPSPDPFNLYLSNGDRLRGKVEGSEGALLLESEQVKGYRVPLAQIDAVCVGTFFGQVQANYRALFDRQREARPRRDSIVVNRGSKPFSFRAAVLEVKPAALLVRMGEQQRELPRDKVYGFVRAGSEKAQHADGTILARVHLSDGGVVTVPVGSIDKSWIKGGGASVSRAYVRRIEFTGSHVANLSSMEPVSRDEVALFGKAPAWRRNGMVLGGPLQLDGVTYANGIGVQAKSRIEFALGGRWQRFYAIAGIDDAASREGQAQFRVLADGKPIADIVRRRGEKPAVPEPRRLRRRPPRARGAAGRLLHLGPLRLGGSPRLQREMTMRWILCAALAALLIAPTRADEALDVVKRMEERRIELAKRLAPSVCAVFKGQGGGSGVIFTEDGLVLSNFHVTGLDAEMRIGLNDNRIHKAVVLGVDPSGDLSVLRLKEKRKWVHAPLGDSDAMQQGDWVYAMGNPFLLATDFTPTITLGVISGVNRYQPGSVRGQLLYPDCIQTDASINPGNSGGPLFNFKAEVIGINGRVSLRERGRVNIGVGYAISSNQIKACLPDMRAGLIVRHGTLNATVRDLDDPEWPGGIRVTFDQMLNPGCAYEAGIRIGDALVSFQGQRVTETNDFLRRISILPEGRRVSLRIARLEKDGWVESDHRVTLEGIQLVKKSVAKRRKKPQAFIDMEIDRTFDAARAAMAPIGDETRTGTIEVRGRDKQPWVETYARRRCDDHVLGQGARRRDSRRHGQAQNRLELGAK